MEMPVLALLLVVQDATAAEAFARYREATRAEVPCEKPRDESEIVVCARRGADRYRVPLITSSSLKEGPHAHTDKLLRGMPVPCGEGAFLVRCGSVGVTGTVSADGKVRYVRRQLAP